MRQDTIQTSIILVTWNSPSNIKTTINSLLKSKSKFKLIIVDNGSKISTVRYLKSLEQKYGFKVIYNSQNLGVVKARFQALDHINTKYVYFSDSDIYFPSFDWLSILEKYFEEDEKVGIVGPLKTSNKFQHPYLDGNLKNTWNNIVDKPISLEKKLYEYTCGKNFEQFHKDLCSLNTNAEKVIKIPPRAISACALLTRTKIAKDSQYSDKEYIKGLWGMEDVDFSWEVNKAGYKVLKATDLYIHHFGHASINESSTDLDHTTKFHNLKYFFEKWQEEVLEWLRKCASQDIALQKEELFLALMKLPSESRPDEINDYLDQLK